MTTKEQRLGWYRLALEKLSDQTMLIHGVYYICLILRWSDEDFNDLYKVKGIDTPELLPELYEKRKVANPDFNSTWFDEVTRANSVQVRRDVLTRIIYEMETQTT